MKKFTLLLITAFLALGLNGWTQVFITELADPNNNLNARYIELYNIGATDVDFTEGTGWLINKYTNGNATVSLSIDLTGTILAGGFYIIAYDYAAGTFLSVYGFEADQLDAVSNGVAGSNGDDTMELIDGTGSVADFYGVQPHADLTSTVWEYEDGRAERAFGATSGTNPPVDADWTTWSDGPGGNFQETKDAPGDFDPAEWIGASSGGNFPPTIANVVYSPFTVTSSTTVSVSADVTDSDGSVDVVELQWGTAPGVLTNSIGMSFDAGDSYISNSDIGVHPNGTIIYFQVYAEDDLGDDNSSSEMSYTVTDPATTTLPYVEPFVADLGDCYTYSVLGPSKYWNWHSDGYAQMNGYNSGATEEDWLVLPGINLDNYSNEVMSFDMWRQYGDQDADNYLKLFYSTDYPGVGDPTLSIWTELNHSQAPLEETWTSSGPVDLSAISGTMVYIAFKYNDMPTNYRWWKIDNISIIESTPVNVTFSVNMEEQIVSTDGVHMAGSFSDWWNPAAIELFDGDLDETYEVTLALYPGFEYQFKYLNGNAWGTDEAVPLACQAPGTSNRFEVTGTADYALDVVCFGSCADCGLLFDYDITIQVDMQNEPSVSGDGVYLAGSFTGWGDTPIAMTQNGTIWSTTVSLEESSFQEYKFVNGDPNNGGNWEFIGNRGFTVPSENTVLEVDCFNSYDPCPVADFVMINEVDADQDGTDAQEFIELYDGGVGNTNLSGLVVVLYNGGDDQSYLPAIDLDGESTNAMGYYVLGSALVPNVDTVIGNTNIIQNGADAVALHIGDATDFPNDTPVTDVNLIDALVYGTGDADATALLAALTPGELQIDEAGRGSSAFHSNQRIPNGSGGLRMTGTYDQSLPTPGEENVSVFNDWTGAVDSNWDDAGNWTNSVPTALIDATIPDVGTNPYPVITGSANANNIYVAAAATLTIDPGADLTTAGQVDVDGGFYMSSNAAGVSASFIDNGVTGGGTFYFDRDLFCSGSTADEADPFGWHYLSAPINGLTTDDLLDYYVNQWDEVGNVWMNFEGTDPCIPYATEYLDDVEAWSLNLDSDYACPTPGTGNVVEFSGAFWSLHTGGFSTAVTATGGSFSGWNMIGNPYPSAIDPAAFNWTGFDNGTNGVAIYDGCAGNYLYSNLGNGYSYKVGPTQGFFMLTSGATEFALDGSERVHDNGTTIYKDAVTNLLTIEATGDGTSDLAYIRFMEDSQTGMDKADFPKLISTTEGLAQIYTTSGENMLAVNALPSTPIVPMGFTSVTTGEYTISAIEANDFSNVVLEDRFTGEQTDLLTDSYTFNYTVSDDANRFFVHFTPLGIGDNAAASINIWSSDHNIYVQTPEINGDIVVFNMMGQEVTRTQVEAGVNVIPVSEVNAFYVVKIVGSDVAKTGKVYVK